MEAVGNDGLIRDIRKYRAVSADRLDKLAAVLGLEFYFGPPRCEAPAPPSIEIDASTYATLPLYGEVRLAAGAGAMNDDAAPSRPVACRADLLRALGTAPGDAMLLTVQGDSMEPLFSQGDTLLIDRARTAPPEIRTAARKAIGQPSGHRAPAAFAFLDPWGEARVKHLRRHPRIGLIASSSNPAYPPDIYPPPDAARITILGQVTALARVLGSHDIRSGDNEQEPS